MAGAGNLQSHLVPLQGCHLIVWYYVEKHGTPKGGMGNHIARFIIIGGLHERISAHAEHKGSNTQ